MPSMTAKEAAVNQKELLAEQIEATRYLTSVVTMLMAFFGLAMAALGVVLAGYVLFLFGIAIAVSALIITFDNENKRQALKEKLEETES